MKLVGMIHSTRLVIESLQRVMAPQYPGIDCLPVMDEGRLRGLTAAGKITPEVIQGEV